VPVASFEGIALFACGLSVPQSPSDQKPKTVCQTAIAVPIAPNTQLFQNEQYDHVGDDYLLLVGVLPCGVAPGTLLL